MPVTSASIDAEREGARSATQDVDGLRDEVTVLAEQVGALGSVVSPDAWCGASADASRGHVAASR